MASETPRHPAAAVPADALSALGHDLRGPLGVARGYLRLLSQTGELSERQAKAVTEASRATDRLAALLDEVSEYHRWLRGDLVLSRSPLPLVPLIREVAAGLSPSSIVFAIDDTLRVEADRTMLARALATLALSLARALPDDQPLRFAVDASDGGSGGADRGGVQITMAPPEPRPASTAEGAASDPLPEPVEPATPTVVEQPLDLRRSGLGLGLALADLVISAHGGLIRERHAAGRWRGIVVRL